MKIYRLLLVIIFVLAMTVGVFSQGKLKATKVEVLKICEADIQSVIPTTKCAYEKYFVYDFLRHKYLEVNENVAKELFSLYIEGDVNEWQKYSEYKIQYYSNSGLLLREEIYPWREDRANPITAELFVYNYVKGTKKVAKVDRYIVRNVSEEGKKAKYKFYKLGYLEFKYNKDGSSLIDYYVLAKKEIGDKIKYEFVQYMQDQYLPDGTLTARVLSKDVTYTEGMPIVGKEFTESLKFMVLSPYWDTETVEEYTAQE